MSKQLQKLKSLKLHSERNIPMKQMNTVKSIDQQNYQSNSFGYFEITLIVLESVDTVLRHFDDSNFSEIRPVFYEFYQIAFDKINQRNIYEFRRHIDHAVL